MQIKFIICVSIFLFNTFCVFATNRVSIGTGNWTTPGTWVPTGLPVAGDNITILSGHTVTMDGNPGTCNNLTINGISNLTNGRITNVVGNLIINNGGSITGSSTGILNVAGTFNVPAGASATIGRSTVTITGFTTIDGTLNFNSTSGTKTFNNVIISSGGTWNSTSAETYTINGNLTMSGGTISGTTTGVFNVAGTFGITAGTNNTLGVGTLSIAGTTTIDGTVSFTSTSGTKTFANVIMNSGAVWNSTVAETYTINNNLTMSGATVSGSAAGIFNVTGNFITTSSTINSFGVGTMTITGVTTNAGSIDFASSTGTKTFIGKITNTGTWTSSANEAFTIRGGITNNGTFSGGIGTYTFNTNSQTIDGSNAISFGGSLAISGAITITNQNTTTVSIASNLTGSATGSTWKNDVNSMLNIGGALLTTGTLTSVAVPSTVNYNGAVAQNIKATTYYNLTIAKTGVSAGSLVAATTVNNNFTVTSGIASIPAFAFTVSGATAITGTVTISSATGAKTFNDILVNTGGTWNVTASVPVTINGNLSNSGTFTANTGTYRMAGAGKIISGTLTVPTFSVTGSYTNNGTLTSSTALQGAGAFSQGATGILNMGTTSANFSVTTFNASASGNTVNYNRAGVQSVRTPSDGAYYHLSIVGSGIKTLIGATTINGNLIISSTLDVSASNFTINLGGDWSNTGIFTPRSGTVTLNGTGVQSITKSGGETFNHLTISGSGTKTLGSAITTNGTLIINSTLDISASNFGVVVKGNWMNNGTFAERSGTVTFSGAAAQTIGGSVTTNFYNITQINSFGVSLTHAQSLINVLTISLGTFTTTGYSFTLVSTASGTASIAAIPGGANFSGNIIMQRYTGTGPTDWRFFSSAVSGATIADWADDFATTGFTGATCNPANCATSGCGVTCNWSSIYTYNEAALGIADSGYVPATNVTNSISNGKGFWVYLGPNPITYSVTGPPNKFSQPLPVTFTSSAGAENDGWNLLANPYPAAIDWDNASWTKTNLNNAIYIYNSSTGSYASYVAGIGVNGGSQYVASQQSFMVQANAASPVLTMVENVKAATQNPVYLKRAYTPNISNYPMAFKDFSIPLNANSNPNSIKLIASGNGYDDETFIRFMSGASANFDGSYDAWKMQNLNPSIPSISSVINDSMDVSINSLPELQSNTTVKIRFVVPTAGTYSIRRDSLLMLPMSSCLILEDLANGNMIDMRSTISYFFTISDTTKSPRFLLHIYAPIAKNAVNTVCSNDSTGMAIVKGTGVGPWNYVWKDAGGNTLQTKNNSTGADTLSFLAAGVYTVQVSGGGCGTLTDTIQIKYTSTFSLSSDFSNVSCNGLSDGTAIAVAAGGSPPYTYLWDSGSSVSAINNITAGNYSVLVTDATGCSQKQVLSISQPSILVSGFTVSADTIDLSVNNSITCTNKSSGAVTYLWSFGDTTYSEYSDTAKNPTHNYSYPGTYIVKLISTNGSCSDTSYRTITVLDLNSITVYRKENLSLVNIAYNNGALDLSFDFSVVADVRVSLYNLLGEKILSEDVYHMKKNQIRLGVPSVADGIYIVLLESFGVGLPMSDVAISKKIIISTK